MTEIHTRSTSVHKEILDRLSEEREATVNEALRHLVSSGHIEAARSLRAHFVEDDGAEQARAEG